jgi:hypothetical protein
MTIEQLIALAKEAIANDLHFEVSGEDTVTVLRALEALAQPHD